MNHNKIKEKGSQKAKESEQTSSAITVENQDILPTNVGGKDLPTTSINQRPSGHCQTTLECNKNP
eukprot:2894428-Amphidinium_carterae.1